MKLSFKDRSYLQNLFKIIYHKSSSNLLKDRITGLPTMISLFPRLEKELGRNPLGLLYIDIQNFKEVESLYGRAVCDHILALSAEGLRNFTIDFFGPRPKVAVCSLGGDDFLIFFYAVQETSQFMQEYTKVKESLEVLLNSAVKSLNLRTAISIHLGYTEIQPLSGEDHIESVIYKAIKEASFAAKNYTTALQHEIWQLLKHILYQKQVNVLYQPIVSLKSGDIMGFEALSRGPVATALESPLCLFNAAQEYNCLCEIETICHQLAIANAAPYLEENYLFLNVNPTTLDSTKYSRSMIQELLHTNGIRKNRVVLEITERTGIEDYETFKEALDYYRNMGFLVAIDDAGAGYSSLQAIAELQPEFVKIDMSLVRNVDKNPTKKALLETFVDFSCKIGARIICEGIETEEELNTLAALGCHYGQGFLLGRPHAPLKRQITSIKEIITARAHKYNSCQESTNSIGEIVTYRNAIDPHTAVEEIIDTFNHNKAISGLIVCQHDNYPIGLIMRDRLFGMLGSRYGYDLFIKKQAHNIMDKYPLILPAYTPLEDAARHVAERLDKGITDYIIVTQDNQYYGFVSIAKMLDSMAKVQIDQARDANPLTGLPGNRAITRRIINGIRDQEDFMVLYLDLDNFKAFNDHFGFEHGDRVLNMVANIIMESVKNSSDDMIGHVGGDDFVIITTIKKGEELAKTCITHFDRHIISMYDRASLEQGYIIALNRQGIQSRFPIMGLSIAGISHNSQKPFHNHLELTEAAAEVKRLAKSIPGSSLVIDYRLPNL